MPKFKTSVSRVNWFKQAKRSCCMDFIVPYITTCLQDDSSEVRRNERSVLVWSDTVHRLTLNHRMILRLVQLASTCTLPQLICMTCRSARLRSEASLLLSTEIIISACHTDCGGYIQPQAAQNHAWLNNRTLPQSKSISVKDHSWRLRPHISTSIQKHQDMLNLLVISLKTTFNNKY